MDATVARMDEAEQQISNIQDKLLENNEAGKKRETKAKEHNIRIRELSDSLKRNNRERSQDGGRAWKLFVCLTSIKYNQTNTEPSYIPRKLIGGLTQQSAQPEPPNCRYVVWRAELGEQEALKDREPLLRVERAWRLGRGEHTGKSPLPKSSWRESGKLETAAGTKLKREKGERRGFKFH